jgi:hypothetical protein
MGCGVYIRKRARCIARTARPQQQRQERHLHGLGAGGALPTRSSAPNIHDGRLFLRSCGETLVAVESKVDEAGAPESSIVLVRRCRFIRRPTSDPVIDS